MCAGCFGEVANPGFIPHCGQMGMVCAGTGVGWDFLTRGLPMMNPSCESDQHNPDPNTQPHLQAP